MKTLIFTDAHHVKENAYDRLFEEIKNRDIQHVKFLGDIDQIKGYQAFFEFRKKLKQENIDFDYIKGNHDQAWLEYAQGLEERVVGNVEIDPSIKTPEYIHHLKNLSEALIEDKILYIHAFPLGKIYSGPLGKKQIEGDRRLKHPKLWHYSFGTEQTIGKGINAYDPEIIQSNFEYMKNNNINYMIKGHEHVSKIWTLEDHSSSIILELIPAGSIKTVLSPAIIQVGSFIDENYLIIDREIENFNDVQTEFYKI
jgi:hypothetical protein